MSGELTIRGDVRRLHLEPGDIIIISLRHSIPRDALTEFKAAAEFEFAPHRVVILADGVELHVQAETEDSAKTKEGGGRSNAP